MAPKSERPTAKIYQFPVRATVPLNDGLSGAPHTRNVTPLQGTRTACGDGWYHEAAVRDEETPIRR